MNKARAESPGFANECKVDALLGSVESFMKWATTGRICEDTYFWIRYRCVRVVAAVYPSCLPLIREAERQLKVHDRYLRIEYDGWWEWLSDSRLRLFWVFLLPMLTIFGLAFIPPFQLPMLVRESPHPSVLTGVLMSVGVLAGESGDPSVLTGVLKSIGAILASLTGILLAVTTLAVKNALEELPGTRFLLGAFAKKKGFAPIAALLFGTLTAIATTIVIGDRLSLQQLNNLTFLSVLAALVSTIFLFDLLRRSLQELGDTDIDELLKTVLTNRWRDYTRSVFRQILIEIGLRRRLAAIGFDRYPSTERESTGQIEYRLRKHGIIVAVDLAPLRRIATLLCLRPAKADLNLRYHGRYGGRNSKPPCVTIPENGRVSAEKSLALLITPSPDGLPPKIAGRIESLVRRAFIVRTPKSTVDRRVLLRLQSVLTGAIERRDASLMRTAFRAFEIIFEESLAVSPAFMDRLKEMGATPPGDLEMYVSYEYSEPRALELGLSKLAIRAHENSSPDCTIEVLRCVSRLALISVEKNHVQCFANVISELYSMYWSLHSLAKAGASTMATDIVDRMISVSDDLFDITLHRDGAPLDQVHRASPYVERFLGLCLCILRISAERSDEATFDAVERHMAGFLDKALQPHHKANRDLCLACNDLEASRNLVYVVACAWLIHKLEGNELRAEHVVPFVEKLVKRVPNFEGLLQLYAKPGMADFNMEPFDFLGFSAWGCLHPHGEDGTAYAIWIKPVYAFLLLKKVAESCASIIVLANIPRTKMADHNSLKRFLTEIACSDYAIPSVCQAVPWGMDAGSLGLPKTRISELLTSWAAESGKGSSDAAEGNTL